MSKNLNKLKFLIFAIVIAVLVGSIGFGLFLQNEKPFDFTSGKQVTPTVALQGETLRGKDYFSYQGQEGKNALTILKEKTAIEQDGSSLVIAINGRKAASAKREYWAFYVNGKMAEVGPADYQTKNEDNIEWKIEKY